MNLKGFRLMVFSALLTLGNHHLGAESSSQTLVSEANPSAYLLAGDETQERVLDIVFPRNDVKGDYSFVLRFRPSFTPESQIIVRRGIDKIEVREYSPLSGSIYQTVNRLIAEGHKENPVELAKHIKIKTRSYEVSLNQMRQWHASLLDSIGPSLKLFYNRSEEVEKGKMTIAQDGTFYDLWYKQGISEMSFSVYDEEIRDRTITGELKLVRWMNSVRNQVAKMK
jgi:hypothetical protein